MTDKTVELVQESWSKVEPIAETAAELFYNQLFTLRPELKPLFKGDMKAQGAKLMQMITVAVRKLNDLDTLVPALQALGVRHVDYGVKPEDYDTVGAALLWTLGTGLGDDFTPEVKQAWTDIYGLMAKTMIDAAY